MLPITKISPLGWLGATQRWHRGSHCPRLGWRWEEQWSTEGQSKRPGSRSPAIAPHPSLLVDSRVTHRTGQSHGPQAPNLQSELSGTRTTDGAKETPFQMGGGSKESCCMGRAGPERPERQQGLLGVSAHPPQPWPLGHRYPHLKADTTHHYPSTWVIIPDRLRRHEPHSAIWEAV